MTFRILRKDGSVPWVELRAIRVCDEAGNLVALEGIALDVTGGGGKRRTNLPNSAAIAVMEERERLARELHDGIGQVLGYVNTQAQAVRELAASGAIAKADAHLTRLISVAQDAHADVREYILSMRAGVPTGNGLLAELGQYLHRFRQSTGLRVELVAGDGAIETAMERPVEVQVLRIIQEALTNVRKHAQAKSAKVIFSRADSGIVRIEITDDGSGFDPTRIDTSRSTFGLRIMRERAHEVAGSFEVKSEAGRGSTVVLEVPAAKDTEDRG